MATLSKAEYLKKYISDGTENEKKKKRKKRKQKSARAKADRLKIVDDDVDFKSLLPDNLGNTLEEDVGDDEPTIADFIDERPEHIKLLEKYREDGRWRVIANEKEKNKSESSKQKQDTDSDQSPPKKRRHDSDSDQSPPRRRHDSDSDQSPPRRRHDSNSDQSPPRRRHESDSDQSLPRRRRRHDSESDQSPPRRQRHDSDSDQSPPRRQRHDSDSDQSPPRRKRHDSESDQSPPRRRRHDSESDQSPPRRKRGHDFESDEKPRKQKGSSVNSDLSPKRKRKEEVTLTKKKKSRWEAEEMGSGEEENTAKALAAIKDARGRAAKTLGGATAGLSSAQQMKYEAKLMKEREEEMFKKLDDEALGRNARTVHRDKKSGRKQDTKEEEEMSAEEAAKAAAKAEKYKAWNKGLKQAELRQQALEEAVHEISKPLSRHRDDADLEAMLKAQEREGDPMLAFIKKKKSEKNAKKKELPRYSGPEPPPNRFNIWPGYRWDGVDRSNGFEKKFFSKLCEKKAVKEIAYKWSVEDM